VDITSLKIPTTASSRGCKPSQRRWESIWTTFQSLRNTPSSLSKSIITEEDATSSNAKNEEQFKEWVDVFRNVCRNAYGLKNKEWVHQKAFHEAVRRTRWELGRWGWWSYGGSEEQILSDMISDQIEWAVMGRIYSKIQGPWPIRHTVRNQVLKTLDTIIMAGVTPAWKAMSSTVETLRPQLEPKIKELADPIGKAEAALVDKVREAVMSILDPLIEQHINPHLGKIMKIIQSPMTEAYEESHKLFDDLINKHEIKMNKDELNKTFRQLDWYPRSWDIYNATRKIDILYDPLWVLHEIFPDIYPWSMIWQGHDSIRKTMDNAIYTYEKKLLDALESGSEGADGKALSDKFKAEVMADYKEDTKTKIVEWYCSVMKGIVYPPFNALANPATSAVIGPIASQVPEPVAQFIDIQQIFTDMLNAIVDSCIEKVVSSGQE